MKKIKPIVMIMLFCILCIWQTKQVQAEVTTGTCGENITYSYDDSTKTLIFSGTGRINTYYFQFLDIDYDLVETLIIEDGITDIYALSSGWSSLKKVTIGNGVTSIHENAFFMCNSLKSVTIGNGVTEISEGAFSFCESLKSVTLGNSLTEIGANAFDNCKALTSITIPNSVTNIGKEAFFQCTSLSSVTIGKGMKNIEKSAFSNCYKLTKVTFKNKKTSIHKNSFAYSDWGSKAASTTNPNVVIYGYKDSTAQKFANKYKIGFQTIGQKQAGKTSITSLSSSKSGAQIQAKWKKVSKAYQYEIQIYDKADKYGYRQFVRVITKKTSLKLKKNKNLEKGKTYYVRVRAYAKRNGYQIISPWSKVKKLKMKK